MRSTTRATAAAAALLLLLLLAPRDATAQTTTPAAAVGAKADAYGLLLDAELTPLDVPVRQGPLARATQDSPPGAAAPAEAQLLAAGPIPAGGELVQGVGALSAIAGANGTPLAAAAAQAVDVRLLAQGGTPLLTAELVRAVSTSDCTSAPSAAGTELVGLRVAGQADPIATPAPNTELLPAVFRPLGLKVVLNEQHPADGGRGLVVNAIHVHHLTSSTVPGLFVGDLVVGHAASSVSCPGGGPGSTGTGDPIIITKDVAPASAEPGDTVTYTATIQNRANVPCLVSSVIDHLPPGFAPTSTAGAFGTTSQTAARPGGGIDVVIRPSETSIPPGGSATQTFVATIADDVASGTYFNDVEVFCANLGNFIMGLSAPVTVQGEDPPASTTSSTGPTSSTSSTTTAAPDGSTTSTTSGGGEATTDDDDQELPRTGGGGPLAAAGASLVLAAGIGALRRRALRA